MKAEKIKGFTLIELLVVLAIIAALIGLLMPALGQVRKYAGNVKQKSQIGSIEIALTLYKMDFGQYPPSHGYDPNNLSPPDPNHPDYAYSGVQTLAEAMCGMDLLGVEPNSTFRSDAKGINSADILYPPNPTKANLDKRKGPYLDRANIGVFQPNQIFKPASIGALKSDGHMICDTFTTQSVKIGAKYYKIGTPILYFRANPSAVNTQLIRDVSTSDLKYHIANIYNYTDNYDVIITARSPANGGKDHKFYEQPFPDGSTFYNFISDAMIPIPPTAPAGSCGRPVHPDSFILISAGPDGIYGTKDDICNFAPNIQ